jgi:glycosyltransferase involved in cell wall biosynthesis
MGDRALRVCLVLEGTYPYVRGGVSSWAHQLISSLPGIEFELLTLSPKPNQTAVYDVPANVVASSDHVLQNTGFELDRLDTERIASRTALIRGIVQPRRGDIVDRLLAELEAVGSIPRRRGARRKRATNEFWRTLLAEHLEENPYYGLGEFYWTWYNSRVTLLRLLQLELPRADVYHTLCTGYAGFLAALHRAETGTPMLLTEHGIYHRERLIEIEATTALRGHQRDQWGEMFLALSRIAYAVSDRTITLFEANRALELAMGAPTDRSQVIPNGIDVERFGGITRTRRPGYHVGLVGRVVPIKDIKTFLVACRIVAEEISDASFYVIGPVDESPDYYQECIEMADAFGLLERLQFTGSVDVREYYAFLDVLVLTSLSEAQPLVILEGVAAGVPAIATRVGDVPDLLSGDTRLIATPKDAEGIASRIVALLRGREAFDGWINERQEAVRTVYNRDRIFGRYGELYREQAG